MLSLPSPQPFPSKNATVPLSPASSQSSTPAPESALDNAHARVGFLQHRVGDQIKNRYEVLEHLGGGNFGSVYRVRDMVVGNILACKEMHVLDDPSTSRDEREEALDLFKREALNLATLRHPHIPSAYFEQEDGAAARAAWRICPRCGFDFPAAPVCPDHGASLLQVASRFYLMMDFVDGPTLEDKVLQAGRPLEEQDALMWIGQVGAALQSLHRIGIVHRDVKPDNIKIRSSDNAAMLLDFGLTKKVEEGGSYGTAPLSGTASFGTPGYAPENLEERENPERRSDIYALGMTLYRVLAARDPQESAQLKELREFSPRYFNKNISPETEKLIAVATAPDLSWRYQSIDDFLSDLQAIHAPAHSEYSAPPFTFADGSRARAATELARLVERKTSESVTYLQNGMFAAWLQQNGFAASTQAASDALKILPDNAPRALEIFRRGLYPQGAIGVLPHLQIAPDALNFGEVPSGASAVLPLQIRNAGAGLAWGEIQIEGEDDKSTPLPGLKIAREFQGNDVRLEINLDTSRVPVGEYSGALLIQTEFESTRVAVTFSVAPLELSIEPHELHFGLVAVGEKFTKEIKIVASQKYASSNADKPRGMPRGTIYFSSNLQGLSAPERFEGDVISVTVDATAPGMVARDYSGALQIDTNGGRFRVPVSYVLALSPGRLLMTVLGISAGAGLAAWAARWLYGLVNPDFASAWLVQQNAGGVPIIAPYQFNVGAVILGVLGALFLSQALAQNIERNSRRKKPDPTLRPIMGCAFLLFSAPLGLAATYFLHYLLWGFGDWLLYPLRSGVLAFLPQDNAPIAWAALGAFGGLLWGTSHVLNSIGLAWARYAAWVALSLTFLVLMLNAMLSTGH